MILRIEDHDRQRSRPEHEWSILEDLERLGVDARRAAARGVQRRHAVPPVRRGRRLRGGRRAAPGGRPRVRVRLLAVDVRPVRGRARAAVPRDRVPGRLPVARASPRTATWACGSRIGAGSERWVDLLVGPMADEPAAAGDLLVRDRVGNWTYALCVVVDDLRHGVDLVIRGRDLLDATPAQLRLATLLGRETPPRFLHHPLIRTRVGPEALEGRGRHGDPPAPRRGTDARRAVRARRAPGRRPRHGRARSTRATSRRCSCPPDAGDVSRARSVLDLPRVVERVPGDPPGGVPWPATSFRRAGSRPTARATP